MKYKKHRGIRAESSKELPGKSHTKSLLYLPSPLQSSSLSTAVRFGASRNEAIGDVSLLHKSRKGIAAVSAFVNAMPCSDEKICKKGYKVIQKV